MIFITGLFIILMIIIIMIILITFYFSFYSGYESKNFFVLRQKDKCLAVNDKKLELVDCRSDNKIWTVRRNNIRNLKSGLCLNSDDKEVKVSECGDTNCSFGSNITCNGKCVNELSLGECDNGSLAPDTSYFKNILTKGGVIYHGNKYLSYTAPDLIYSDTPDEGWVIDDNKLCNKDKCLAATKGKLEMSDKNDVDLIVFNPDYLMTIDNKCIGEDLTLTDCNYDFILDVK